MVICRLAHTGEILPAQDFPLARAQVEVHAGDIVDCPKGKDGAHCVESLTEEQGALVANKYVVAWDMNLLCCMWTCLLPSQHMHSNMASMQIF